MKIDALMLQNKRQTSTFSLDIQLGRNVICGQSVLNHENNPKENCDCYFCKKHWSKMGGRPSFKSQRFVWLLIATKFNNSKTLGEIGFVVIWTSDGHSMNDELVPFKCITSRIMNPFNQSCCIKLYFIHTWLKRALSVKRIFKEQQQLC